MSKRKNKHSFIERMALFVFSLISLSFMLFMILINISDNVDNAKAQERMTLTHKEVVILFR